jgi:hypothetical protein
MYKQARSKEHWIWSKIVTQETKILLYDLELKPIQLANT